MSRSAINYVKSTREYSFAQAIVRDLVAMKGNKKIVSQDVLV